MSEIKKVLQGNEIIVALSVSNENQEQFDFTGVEYRLALHSKVNGLYEVHVDSHTGGVLKGSVTNANVLPGLYYLDLICWKSVNGIRRYRRSRSKELLQVTNDESATESDGAIEHMNINMRSFK